MISTSESHVLCLALYRQAAHLTGQPNAPYFPLPHAPTMAGFRKFLLADATHADKTESTQDGHSSLIESLADPDTFNWCLECVLSRAFQLPPGDAAPLVFDEDDDVPVRAPAVEPPAPEAARMALLPLIDSMNHYSRMPTHMHWEADGAISLAGGRMRVVACTSSDGLSGLYRRSCEVLYQVPVVAMYFCLWLYRRMACLSNLYPCA